MDALHVRLQLLMYHSWTIPKNTKHFSETVEELKPAMINETRKSYRYVVIILRHNSTYMAIFHYKLYLDDLWNRKYGSFNNIKTISNSLENDIYYTLQWRHNEHDVVSYHQPHDCLLNCLLMRISKKI